MKKICFLLASAVASGSAAGSMIGDTINWQVGSGLLGGGSGSAVVSDPGIEAEVVTITFITTRRADLRADNFTIEHLPTQLAIPETTWIFSDIDVSGRQVISGVSQTSGAPADSVSFTEDSITVNVPGVGGNSTFDFDVEFESVSALAKDDINWSFNAGLLGGTSGSAVIGEGIEAAYDTLTFDVHSHADLTEDTLTLNYDPGGLASVLPSVWTFTDLDWINPVAPIGQVVQTGGAPVDNIIVTGDSITIHVQETGAADFTFDIIPLPEPASLSLMLVGFGAIMRRPSLLHCRATVPLHHH